MFRPGHVEVHREPALGDPGFRLSLDYQVQHEAADCRVDFELQGEVAGRQLHECFSLRRDVAYNFLQSAGRCLRRRGIRANHPALFAFHADYDLMFADLRRQLQADCGEPVDLQRFLQDRGEVH